MKLRARFTIQQLMVVVALVGSWMSLVAYRERLRGLSEYHASRAVEESVSVPASPNPPPGTRVETDPSTGIAKFYRRTPRADWHDRMAARYSGSARDIGELIGLPLFLMVILGVAAAFRRKKRPPLGPNPSTA